MTFFHRLMLQYLYTHTGGKFSTVYEGAEEDGGDSMTYRNDYVQTLSLSSLIR